MNHPSDSIRQPNLLIHSAAWAARPTAAVWLTLIVLSATFASGSAIAQSQFLAYSAACQSDCDLGPTVLWTPPSGSALTSSAAKSWSFIDATGNSNSNFAVSASAQATIGGPNKWSASSSAGGYFNGAGTFTSNGVAADGVVKIREEFTLPQTSTWQGPGWLRLTYHITGNVGVRYSETSSSSGQKLGTAESSITFECGSARIGGSGSSRCESADFAPPAPGSLNLIGRLKFDASEAVDRTVSFDVSVFSNQPHVYQLQTTVDSRLMLNATNRTGQIVGLTSADFSQTFTLAAAQLYDTGFNKVPQWSIRAGSGFDYANIAAIPVVGAIPEPTTNALLVVGLLALGWKLRRRPLGAGR